MIEAARSNAARMKPRTAAALATWEGVFARCCPWRDHVSTLLESIMDATGSCGASLWLASATSRGLGAAMVSEMQGTKGTTRSTGLESARRLRGEALERALNDPERPPMLRLDESNFSEHGDFPALDGRPPVAMWLVPLETQAGHAAGVVLELDGSSTDSPRASPRLAELTGQIACAISLADVIVQSNRAAIAEERERFAREIHDGIAQVFIGIGMLLQHANSSNEEAIVRARNMAADGLAEARRSVRALRSPLLLSHSFLEAVEELGRRLVVAPTRFLLVVNGTWCELDSDAEAQLFRIVQEAIGNAARHSRARRITVEASCAAHEMSLLVADDGCGFDAGSLHGTDGFGLHSMQQRGACIGASVETASIPGRGTQVLISLPLALAARCQRSLRSTAQVEINQAEHLAMGRATAGSASECPRRERASAK